MHGVLGGGKRPRRVATREHKERVIREIMGTEMTGASVQELRRWLQGSSVLGVPEWDRVCQFVQAGGAEACTVGLAAAVARMMTEEQVDALLAEMMLDRGEELGARSILLRRAWQVLPGLKDRKAQVESELLQGLHRPVEVEACLSAVEESTREVIRALAVVIGERMKCGERRGTGILCPFFCL